MLEQYHKIFYKNTENMDNYIVNNNQSDDFDLKNILKIGLKYWYLFIILPIICALVAVCIKKFTVPEFTSSASLMVKWDDAINSSKMLNLPNVTNGWFGGHEGEIDDEITIIKSNRLFNILVDNLNLRTETYYKKNMLYYLLYNNEPLVAVFPQNFVKNLTGSFTIFVTKHGNDDFTFNFEFVEKKIIIKEKHRVSTLNEPIKTQWGEFSFVEQQKYLSEYGESYKLKIVTHSLKGIAGKINKEVSITRNSKSSNILVFSITSSNYVRNEVILNKLMDIYQNDKISDQNQISLQMADFITERLGLISEELKDVEEKVETYRKKHNIADISAQSHEFISKSSDYEKQIANTEIQLSLINFIETYLKKTENDDLLPANTGIQEASVNEMIKVYNELVFEYKRASASATSENPVLVRLQSKISTMKENILQSIDNYKKSAEITKSDLKRKSSDYYSKINQVPTIQREFTDIARQQQIKETLFVFLLQKREEAQLALAMATSSAKIVEAAQTGSAPKTTGLQKMVMMAIIIGLILAAAITYLIDFFNDNISSTEELRKYTKLPLIGSLPFIKNAGYLAVTASDRASVLGEKFRMLRTNLPFVIQNKDNKVVLITSSMPEEGKSFVSINLALSLALINKKVALLGLDVRKPRLSKYLNLNATPGVTNYISDEEISLQNIEQKTDINKNISIFVGGTIPPNPSELLYNERLDMLFEELRKKFDYIIVDSAPVGVITDTFIVGRAIDAVIYVVKAGVAKYSDIKRLNEFVDEKKIKNVSILLNNIEEDNRALKYGYYNTV
jgi:capsular exopolysaccharide synthesis family protein